MTSSSMERTTGLAVEVLTAQFDDTSSKNFATKQIQKIAAEGAREGGDAGGVRAVGDLCAGLINVAGRAIEELSEATGFTPLEWLQKVALGAQDK